MVSFNHRKAITVDLSVEDFIATDKAQKGVFGTVYVGVTGNIKVKVAGGTTVTYTGVQAGTILKVQVGTIFKTGTTATNLVFNWE